MGLEMRSPLEKEDLHPEPVMATLTSWPVSGVQLTRARLGVRIVCFVTLGMALLLLLRGRHYNDSPWGTYLFPEPR
jgi:hypothetical protein